MRPSRTSTRPSYASSSQPQQPQSQPHMQQQQQQQPQPPQPQQSQLQQSHPPPSAAQLARLTDKKKEFEAVEALQRASALFLRRLEGLADDCEAMAEAGIVHGQVLAQWPQMFRILNMFVAAREASATPNDGTEVDADAHVPSGGRLVRVPIDELQQAESK